jgi:hypothetical protein
MSKPILTQERLKELLHYDPDTGVFTWKTAVGRGKDRQYAGAAAGRLRQDGYIRIGIGRMRYMAHRLAFVYKLGSMPAMFVDHINGIKHDNRWENLREATVSENGQNTRLPKGNNPLIGAYWRGGRRNKWEAQLCVAGVHRHLGYFDTAEEAHSAFVAAKRIHHPFNTL